MSEPLAALMTGIIWPAAILPQAMISSVTSWTRVRPDKCLDQRLPRKIQDATGNGAAQLVGENFLSALNCPAEESYRACADWDAVFQLSWELKPPCSLVINESMAHLSTSRGSGFILNCNALNCFCWSSCNYITFQRGSFQDFSFVLSANV